MLLGELLLFGGGRRGADAVLHLVPVARELAEGEPLGRALLHRLDADLGDVARQELHRARAHFGDLGIGVERGGLRIGLLPVGEQVGGARAIVGDQLVELVLRGGQGAALVADRGELAGADHKARPERHLVADEIVVRLDRRGRGSAGLHQERRIGIELLVGERRRCRQTNDKQ